MSVADSATTKKPGTEAGRPHDIHLAIQFKSKTSGSPTESTSRLPRQATRQADIALVMERLAEAVDYVLNNADEGADAVVTLALLHKVRS